MEKYEREAAAAAPGGYGRITSGPLRSDDLVWDWVNKKFLRHDSPYWSQTLENAVHAVYALRSTRIDPDGFGGSREYRINQ